MVRAAGVSAGPGPFSGATSTRTPADPAGLPHDSPVTFSIVAAGWNRINVDWDVVLRAQRYLVRRRAVVTGQIATFPPDLPGEHDDATLSANTESCYAVMAIGWGGDSAWSTEACATIRPLPGP